MERKIISIDISPESLDEAYKDNGGVMWEHNAVKLVFTIAPEYAGDYRYYIEYRSAIGAKVRTEYLTLDEATSTVSYDIPAAMSSLKCVECLFNIVNIDNDGRTVQVIKPKKFYLEFDYSPDTDNYLCRVNNFSVNALLEAIRNGTFKGETAYGDKEYSPGSLNPQSGIAVCEAVSAAANTLRGTATGHYYRIDDISPVRHELDIQFKSDTVTDFTGESVIISGKNLFDNTKALENKDLGKDGVVVDCENTRLSDLIRIVPNGREGNKITISHCKNWSIYNYDQSCYICRSGDNPTEKITLNLVDLTIAYLRFSYDTTVTDGSDVQVELGTVVTDYVPFVEPKTFYADKSGKIENAYSAYPTTSIRTVNPKVNAECSYNKDLTKVIDSIAQEINKLGGNVSV